MPSAKNKTHHTSDLQVLARQDRWMALGRLTGSLAHELNNPLTNILVFAETLNRQAEKGSSFFDQASEILGSARRCRDLIYGILKFARRPRVEPESTVLPQVVGDIERLVRHQADMARVKLEIHLPNDLPPVMTCVSDLEQVLVDLFLLAIESCPPQETVYFNLHRPATSEGEQNLMFLLQASAPWTPNTAVTKLSTVACCSEQVALWKELLMSMGGRIELFPQGQPYGLALFWLQRLNQE